MNLLQKSIINIKLKICNLAPKKYSEREYAPQKVYKLSHFDCIKLISESFLLPRPHAINFCSLLLLLLFFFLFILYI